MNSSSSLLIFAILPIVFLITVIYNYRQIKKRKLRPYTAVQMGNTTYVSEWPYPHRRSNIANNEDISNSTDELRIQIATLTKQNEQLTDTIAELTKEISKLNISMQK
jgi:hypothetical protein